MSNIIPNVPIPYLIEGLGFPLIDETIEFSDEDIEFEEPFDIHEASERFNELTYEVIKGLKERSQFPLDGNIYNNGQKSKIAEFYLASLPWLCEKGETSDEEKKAIDESDIGNIALLNEMIYLGRHIAKQELGRFSHIKHLVNGNGTGRENLIAKLRTKYLPEIDKVDIAGYRAEQSGLKDSFAEKYFDWIINEQILGYVMTKIYAPKNEIKC